jgi:hypothetical protein
MIVHNVSLRDREVLPFDHVAKARELTSVHESLVVPMADDFFHGVRGVINSLGDKQAIGMWLARHGAGRRGGCDQGSAITRVRSTRATCRVKRLRSLAGGVRCYLA